MVRRGRWFVVALVLASVGFVAPVPATATDGFETLTPGQRADLHQTVPVTVVLVGLEPGSGPASVDPARLVAGQHRSVPIRDRTTRQWEKAGIFDDLEPSTIGITYDYEYRTVLAPTSFEDAFFAHLAGIAIALGPTLFQQAYSSHPLAAEHIGGNLLINAVAAERWLADNAGPMLGVDTSRPTVFFVNWYGRPDFRFHTYAFLGGRRDVPFPTGATHAGQMVAWGGTPADGPHGHRGTGARVWLYDVSAGPDYTTANWLLDVADFTGDGTVDERIPPIWEYGTGHWYRPFGDLTADLSALLRFTVVDTIFGAHPIYDPAVSEPLLADRVEFDLNVFAGRPGRNPLSTLRAEDLPARFRRLDRTREFTTDVTVAPLTGEVSRAFDCQQTAYTAEPQSCYGDRPYYDPFYDLDLYFGRHRNQYLDATRYELPMAVFDVPESRLVPGAFPGIASSRPPNIQDWTYAFLADRFRFGSLFTDTYLVSHEAGHHLGLSHGHDAYDPVLDTTAHRADGRWYMASGMETYTAMSYLPNTDEFGQFDRDNMARWQVAARIDNANRILGAIERSPRAARARLKVLAADAKAGEAQRALDAWDLEEASAAAQAAYRLILEAAADANVMVEPYAGAADGQAVGIIDAASDPYFAAPVPAAAQDPYSEYGR